MHEISPTPKLAKESTPPDSDSRNRCKPSAVAEWTRTLLVCAEEGILSCRKICRAFYLYLRIRQHNRFCHMNEADIIWAGNFSTVIVLRMAHRKWQETKLQPSMLPGLTVPGCCLVSLHIMWAILSTSTVQCFPDIETVLGK